MGRTGRVYRRVRANFTDKPTFFTWVRDSRLAASGRPFSKGQVDWLKESGVTAILTLTEDPLPGDWTKGIETRHISLSDHAPLSASQMGLGADYIASALAQGKVVLVHCLAGKGRTGCVLAAYMMAYEGKTARQAIGELRSNAQRLRRVPAGAERAGVRGRGAQSMVVESPTTRNHAPNPTMMAAEA